MSVPERLLQVGDDVPPQTLVNVQGSKWCVIAEHGKVIWAGHYTEMVKLIREAAKNAARRSDIHQQDEHKDFASGID